MAHATQQTIEQLNSSIALERLMASRGIELTERVGVLVGACPWCGQGEALVVKPKENTWACEPGSVSGGVVDRVQRIEGVSIKHAVELLRADALDRNGVDRWKTPHFDSGERDRGGLLAA